MLNKIKQKIIELCRQNCGYYELKTDYLNFLCEVFGDTIKDYNKINLSEIIFKYNKNKSIEQCRFLIKELESILNTMNEKGKHPKDIIKNVIKEADKRIAKMHLME